MTSENKFVSSHLTSDRIGKGTSYVTVGMAGAAARVAVNPFSAAKIFMEVGAPGSRMGITKTLHWITKLHGTSALFTRGAGIAAARAAPHYIIQISVFDRLVSNFVRHPGNRLFTIESAVGTYIAGACSGMAATLLTHPMDVVKTRMVVQGPVISYKGSVQAFEQIVYQEGFYRGIYRGLGVSLVGSAVFSGNFFMIWGILDNIGWRRRGAPPYLLGRFEPLLIPTVALGMAAFITHPVDILRRKLMAQSFALPKEGNVDVRFNNVGECLARMPKYGNIYSYYAGITSNMIKTVPQVAVFAATLWGLQTVLSMGD
jgi:hypothetical protein